MADGNGNKTLERESTTPITEEIGMNFLFSQNRNESSVDRADQGRLTGVEDDNTEEDIKEPEPEEPQAKLLWALKYNRYNKFIGLISTKEVNIKYQYTKPQYSEYGTSIEIASRLPNRGKFVKALLEAGIKPNVHEILPEPIHFAAREGNPDALRVLLQDKRTNINAVDSKDRTALHHAVKYSNKDRADKYAECITMLLKRHDFDINKPNKKGWTAIREAANTGKEVVLLFLKHRYYDLDLDTHRSTGRSSREFILNKYPDLKPILPQMKQRKTASDINNRLLFALQNRDLKDFTQILQRVDNDGDARVNPNFFYGIPYNATCLDIACKENDCADFVQQLLNAGADPNLVNPITKQIPLHLAAELGNEKVLSVLLQDRRTNINILNDNGKSVLHIIAECEGNEEQMKCLKVILGKQKRNSNEIAVRVNQTDNRGKMAVEIAVAKEKNRFVEIILEEAGGYMNFNASVGEKNETLSQVICDKFRYLKENIPSHRDVTRQDSGAELFQLLCNRKIEEFLAFLRSEGRERYVNSDDGNYTILQYATLNELKDPIIELIKCGSNPNTTTDFEKRPPIIIATQKKKYELLNIFLNTEMPKDQLDINAVDAKGNTALHFASKNEDLDSVVDLIKHGANYGVKNVFGKSPLPPNSVSYFLDNSLRTNDKYPEDEDYELIFDYEFLTAKKQDSGSNPQQHTQQKDIERHSERTVPHLSEMNFLLYLSESEEHKKVMKHPIIASFLEIKWVQHKNMSHLTILIWTLLVSLINAYIILDFEKEESASTFDIIAKVILGFCFLTFGIYLIINVTSSFKKFFLVFTNWVDLCLTSCIVALLFITDIPSTLAVVTIFLSWFKLILITHNRTALSVNLEILRTVSFNYLQFLLSYISLIFAFAFSFYCLLHEVAKEKERLNLSKNKNSDEYYGFYMSPLLSIQKVFIMMMGEFEAGKLLPQIKDYGLCFWLLFLFVFVMAMVLVNLLTGLAVNDIQNIKKNAIEVSLASKVRLIYEMEKNYFGLIEFCNSWKVKYLYRHLLNRSIRKYNIFPDNSSKIVHIYPNKGRKIIFDDKRIYNLEMDLDILRDTLTIISNPDKNMEDFNIKQAFNQLKESNDQLLERIRNIEEKLGVQLNEEAGS